MTGDGARAFATAKDLEKWLKANHAKERELWVRIFKKGSGTPSVTWQDCVVACLAWGCERRFRARSARMPAAGGRVT